jgi:hypothetical protein
MKLRRMPLLSAMKLKSSNDGVYICILSKLSPPFFFFQTVFCIEGKVIFFLAQIHFCKQ